MHTNYHAKYFAHELTRSGGDGLDRIRQSLFSAAVDLNPHQIEAALFAFRSPFSRGVILADEVGLGKTIEAGIVLAQKWAERKRKLLLVLPVNLRRQWQLELEEKFQLPSQIVERRDPIEPNKITILSYHAARNRADELRSIPWDLVVLDEAHRLRNVYKNGNVTAQTLKHALQHAPKLLLTATPLQNSVLELYGLISLIDEHIFGDLRNFRNRFARATAESSDFEELKHRLKNLCCRTLRSQVKYIKFTSRIAHTQEFIPTREEDELYEAVSEYLRRPEALALPPGQRSLLTLVMRKLLSSSPAAIAGALEALAQSLESRYREAQQDNSNEYVAASYDKMAGLSILRDCDEDFPDDDLDMLTDRPEVGYSYQPATEEMTKLQEEASELFRLAQRARQLQSNTKSEALLIALKQTLKDKALVFTESRKTQDFLKDFLLQNGFAEDDLIIFHGSVAGKDRPELVEKFRTRGKVMIATEAGAEGLNLQFCSLVINYDLPWNPQRIEQRIGRCHRYGQKNDVVVVNFLNKNNAADRRVYELLDQKFRLFNGVFGASDEVLGAIESGIDFEKRIAAILDCCRTPAEIDRAFDELKIELSADISKEMKSTRQKLLDHFDTEVAEKLQVYQAETQSAVSRFEAMLWMLTRHELPEAKFCTEDLSFEWQGKRYGIKDRSYHAQSELAQSVLNCAKARELPQVELTFTLDKNIAILKPLVGTSGSLMLRKVTVQSVEIEEYLHFGGVDDSGNALDPEQMRRLFELPATIGQPVTVNQTLLHNEADRQQAELLEQLSERNGNLFDEELDKLERWADDCKSGLELKLKDLDTEIKLKRAESRKQVKLDDKVQFQRLIKNLEARRSELRRKLFDHQDEIDAKKETLLNDAEQRLQQSIASDILFLVKWRIEK